MILILIGFIRVMNSFRILSLLIMMCVWNIIWVVINLWCWWVFIRKLLIWLRNLFLLIWVVCCKCCLLMCLRLNCMVWSLSFVCGFRCWLIKFGLMIEIGCFFWIIFIYWLRFWWWLMILWLVCLVCNWLLVICLVLMGCNCRVCLIIFLIFNLVGSWMLNR